MYEIKMGKWIFRFIISTQIGTHSQKMLVGQLEYHRKTFCTSFRAGSNTVRRNFTTIGRVDREVQKAQNRLRSAVLSLGAAVRGGA